MTTIPARTAQRMSAALKRFQPIITAAQTRDVNESDTAIIITDILGELFGYDKYSEVTSESAIRGTYCDLAVKLDGRMQFLIESKAVNQELKDSYVKQAVDYAANEGVDWVLLTNGVQWRVYKVAFTKPIDQELVFEFDFLKLDSRSEEHLEALYRLTKEGWGKSVLGEYFNQKQALSRYCIAALMVSDAFLAVVRRELRKLSPDVRISQEQIRHVLEHEVLKREVVEGEKADEARKRINRHFNRVQRNRDKGSEPEPVSHAAESAIATPAPGSLSDSQIPSS